MILYYKEILNYIITNKMEIIEKSQDMKLIIKNNTVNEICHKIDILLKNKQNIKYNANLNLLMDKLIIELEGGI